MFSDRLRTRTRLPALFLGVLAASSLVGCGQTPPSDTREARLQWARAALARNPALEVVAVDAREQVISVRERATGALRSVRVEDLAAMPPPATAVAVAVAGATAPAAVAESAPTGTAPTGTGPGAGGAAAPASTADTVRPGEPATAGSVAPPRGEPVYAIARDGRSVTITGPGVSITSQPAPAIVTTSTGSLAPPEGTARQSEPLRCQGGRFLRLDNQRLAFSGDGIVAEDGCELYLTNSRIEALGTALVADAAKVHLANSTLNGGTGSLKMQNGAEIYVGGSTLKGISRRFDTSQLHDLGGNHWD